jgi:hypothetical protein
MEHIAFQGGMGTTRLGTFTTKTSGVGDTQLSGLFRSLDDGRNYVHLQAGFTLPAWPVRDICCQTDSLVLAGCTVRVVERFRQIADARVSRKKA